MSLRFRPGPDDGLNIALEFHGKKPFRAKTYMISLISRLTKRGAAAYPLEKTGAMGQVAIPMCKYSRNPEWETIPNRSAETSETWLIRELAGVRCIIYVLMPAHVST
ncbi:MAG: hypothetical protein ACRER0_04180, partial [Gammaproteobacteria bacterium]